MEKIETKLKKKKITPPNKFIYCLLGYFWKFTVAKNYHIKATYINDPRNEKGPYILLSNHASRMDYIFTATPLLPHTFNFVAGYNEFFRSHLKGIFSLLHEIPKKNFTPDMYAVMEMKRVINKGGRLTLFPEGMSSISGGSQPVALGSAKLLKFLKAPVYVANIKGAYLVSPKYNLKERKGNVEVSFKKLFDVETLNKLNEEEITSILNKEIYTNDYEYNEIKKNHYKEKDLIKNIEQLLYKCPKCGKEFLNFTKDDFIECSSCHNKVYMNDMYELYVKDGRNVYFKNPKLWFDYERSEVKKEIQNKDFEFLEEVDIGFLDDYKYLKHQKTSNIEGNGVLKINHNGIFFEGLRNNKPFNFSLSFNETPTYGMCTDASRFYTFLKGEFIEFFPKRNSTIKWLLLTEEMHRLHNGRWKDYEKDESN